MTISPIQQRKRRSRSYADLGLLALIAVFSLVWTLWGLKLFFGIDNFFLNTLPHFPFGSDWGRGELGDFLGGGLTGATLLLLFHSLTVQTRQLSIQQSDAHEAGVFRTFQALRSEVEGISVRIVSKYLRVKKENSSRGNWDDQKLNSALEGMSFTVMHKKYQNGDKTVFLRFIQKLADKKGGFELQHVASQIAHAEEKDITDSDKKLKESLIRFCTIMALLEKSLKEKEEGDDFSEAIRSTEIFVTYEKFQRHFSTVKEELRNHPVRLTDAKAIQARSNSFGSVRCGIYFSIYAEFEEIAIKQGFEFLERKEVNSRSRSLFFWSFLTTSLGDDETIVYELYFRLGNTQKVGLEVDWERSTY